MKKYNLSAIMKRAWELVKKAGMTLSSGLKKAWKEAKEMTEKIKFAGKAKVAKVHNGIIDELGAESSYFTFSLWEKGGKKRIYANDYKRRSVGFIDCLAGNIITTEFNYGSEVRETMRWFLANYEF